jgi:hypothetical protein
MPVNILLNPRISKKISLWIFILTASVIIATFLIFFILSQLMFTQSIFPFLLAAGIFSLAIIFLYFVIKRQIRINIETGYAAIFAAEQKRQQDELKRIASQVAHDIASPIAVLGVVEATLPTLPEDSRLLIKNAISKIRNISSDLLKKARKDPPYG